MNPLIKIINIVALLLVPLLPAVGWIAVSVPEVVAKAPAAQTTQAKVERPKAAPGQEAVLETAAPVR